MTANLAQVISLLSLLLVILVIVWVIVAWILPPYHPLREALDQITPANINGAITGDAVTPTLAQAFVNWRESSNGDVVEVLFSEDVDSTFASDPLNWSSVNGLSVLAAQQVTPHQYRLTMSLPPVSTDDLELVDIPDLAKNLSGSIATTIHVP